MHVQVYIYIYTPIYIYVYIPLPVAFPLHAFPLQLLAFCRESHGSVRTALRELQSVAALLLLYMHSSSHTYADVSYYVSVQCVRARELESVAGLLLLHMHE